MENIDLRVLFYVVAHSVRLLASEVTKFNIISVQNTISKYYQFILDELRADPEYFRVGFYGGFPPFLKVTVQSLDHLFDHHVNNYVDHVDLYGRTKSSSSED